LGIFPLVHIFESLTFDGMHSTRAFLLAAAIILHGFQRAIFSFLKTLN